MVKDLKKIIAELVYENQRNTGDTKSVLLVFEKYYFRVESYVGLTVLLTEYQETITADLIGSAGGAGFLNFNYGANQNFVEKAKDILKRSGFQEEMK